MDAWKAVLLENGERHVLPINDYRIHDERRACWCSPFEDNGVIVHHSLDQRERYERGELHQS